MYFWKSRTETLNPRRLWVFLGEHRDRLSTPASTGNTWLPLNTGCTVAITFFFFLLNTGTYTQEIGFPILILFFSFSLHLHLWQLAEAHRLPFKRPTANGVRVQIDWTFPGKRLHHTAERLTSLRAALRLTKRYLTRKGLSGRGRIYPPGRV